MTRLERTRGSFFCNSGEATLQVLTHGVLFAATASSLVMKHLLHSFCAVNEAHKVIWRTTDDLSGTVVLLQFGTAALIKKI